MFQPPVAEVMDGAHQDLRSELWRHSEVTAVFLVMLQVLDQKMPQTGPRRAGDDVHHVVGADSVDEHRVFLKKTKGETDDVQIIFFAGRGTIREHLAVPVQPLVDEKSEEGVFIGEMLVKSRCPYHGAVAQFRDGDALKILFGQELLERLK